MHGDILHTHLLARVCMTYIVIVLIITCCHVYYSIIVHMPQTECRWLYRDYPHRNSVPENVRTTSAVEINTVVVLFVARLCFCSLTIVGDCTLTSRDSSFFWHQKCTPEPHRQQKYSSIKCDIFVIMNDLERSGWPKELARSRLI